MRLIRSALAAIALLSGAAPLCAHAKAWQGVTPGATPAAELEGRFGPPSTRGKLGGRAAYVYKDEAAIGATRQAQFFAGDDGIVAEIVVFPAARIDAEAVEGTYGKPSKKAFTDDLRPVWYYPAAGITVFFGKAGQVDAMSFRPGEAAPPRDPGAHAAAAPR
jgi:hypothetical protein